MEHTENELEYRFELYMHNKGISSYMNEKSETYEIIFFSNNDPVFINISKDIIKSVTIPEKIDELKKEIKLIYPELFL